MTIPPTGLRRRAGPRDAAVLDTTYIPGYPSRRLRERMVMNNGQVIARQAGATPAAVERAWVENALGSGP
jgi:hypothetical protein